ncbi:MAG: glutamate ligase domain-containing protein [Candidatus Puniceispirillales bacterium]
MVSKRVDKIKLKECFTGLKFTSWPARAQILNNGKLVDKLIDEKRIVMLDGAHNVSGAKALRKTLAKIDNNWILIFGYLKTRRPDDYLQEMHTISKNIITTRIPGDVDCYSPYELLNIAKNKGYNCSKSNNIVEAINTAQKSRLNVCICGSLYLAGSFLSLNETIPN